MRVLFVRHAAAVEKGAFLGSDLRRPLTDEGRKKAKTAFRALARVCGAPEIIISSQAVRAVETAEILSEAFGGTRMERSDVLNPGCDFAQFKDMVCSLGEHHDALAVVGHEPDLSVILSHVVAGGHLRVEMKKASCAEVEMNRLGKGELKLLVTAGMLNELGRET